MDQCAVWAIHFLVNTTRQTKATDSQTAASRCIAVMATKSLSINTSNSQIQYEAASQVSLVYLIIVGTFGFIGNSLVLLVFLKYAKLRTTNNLFILNLALCDLVITILDSSFSIVSSYNRRWMFGHAGCQCYGFLHYFFISITVSTLAAISVDRFFYITKPVQSKAWRITKTRALAMLVIIYIYVLLFTFPPLTGWNSFIEEEHFYSGCYINYGDQAPPSIGYAVIASMFLFLVPLIVMIFCYSKIFVAVRVSARKTTGRGPSTPGSIRKKSPLFKRTHVQTAKMIIVVIFFCIIVWLPYVVVSLLKAFSGLAIISPLASHITILVAKSCVLYNVLIYVILNRKLKAAVIDLICCGKATDFLTSGKSSAFKLRMSRMWSETDKDVPSDVARNRLSAIAAAEDANGSRAKPPAILRQEQGYSNPDLHQIYSPPLVTFKTETNEIVYVVQESQKLPLGSGRNGVAGSKGSDYGKGLNRKRTIPLKKGPTEVAQDGHTEGKMLSFVALQDEEKYNQHGDMTRERARKRASALRTMNGVSRTERSYSLQTPSADSKVSTQISQNNNNFNVSQTPSRVYIVHSREDSSSSTAIPHSATSTISDATSAKDDTSSETTPVRRHAVPARPKHNPNQSKSMGYRGGRSALLSAEKSKKTGRDPLHVSQKELHEIQNYWKRMSLCLDEINIDEDMA